MANKGKITELFDIKALEDQLKEVVDNIIGEFIKSVEETKKLKIDLKGAIKPSDITSGIDAITASQAKQNAVVEKSVKPISEMIEAQKKLNQQGQISQKSIDDQAASLEELLQQYVETQFRLDELKKVKKGLDKAFQDGLIDELAYKEALADLKLQQVELSVSMSDVNRALKNIQKEFAASDGSIDQMAARLALLQQAYKALSDEEKESEIGKETARQLNELSAKINEQKKSIGDFSSNVGRYAESLGSGFERVANEISKLKVQQDELKTSFQNLSDQEKQSPIGFEITKRIDATAMALDGLEKTQSIGFKTGQNYATVVKSLEKNFASLTASGQYSKEFLEEFEKFIISTKREANDLSKEIKAVASETRGLDLAVSAISTIASSFELASGAAALFGDSSEQVEEITKKLIAVQSVANGVREIGKQLTEKTTAAGKAYVFIQKQIAIVTNASSTATQRFSAVLKLTGIGLLITGVTLLISKLNIFGHTSKETAKDVDILSAAISNQNRVIDLNIGRIRLLNQKLINDAKERGATESEINQLVLKGYVQEQLEYNKQIQDRKKTSKGFYDAEGKNIALFVNSQTQAVAALNNITNVLADPKKLEEYRKNLAETGGTKTAEKIKEDFEASKVFVEGLFDLYKKRDDVTETFQQTAADRRIKIAEKEREEAKKNGDAALKDYEDRLRKELDLEQTISDAKNAIRRANLEQTIRDNERIANDPEEEVKKRTEAAIAIANAETQIAEDEYLQAIESEIKIEDGKRVIYQKTAEERLLARTVLQNKLKEIAIKEGDTEVQISKDTYEKQAQNRVAALAHQLAQQEINTKELDNYYSQQAADEEERYLKELEAAGDNKKKIEKVEKEHARNLLKIQFEREEKLLAQQIEYAEKNLEIARINARLIEDPAERQAALDEIGKAEKDLAGLKIDLQTLVAAHAIATNKDITKSEEEKNSKLIADLEKFKEKFLAVFDIIGQIVGVSVQKELNKIQELEDALDDKSSNDIERVEKSLKSEQDKAAQIAIIEARTQAQKDQLEQRRRQAQERQARFEKAQTIASIILNTALAIVKALGNPFEVALAAALGATQLAVAIATPIPKYKHGTGKNDHPGGEAVVGDGGKSEGVLLPSGRLLKTPNRSVVWDLPKGTKVFPDYSKLAISASLVDVPDYTGGRQANDNELVILGLSNVEKAINRIPATQITVENQLSKKIRSGNSSTKYVKR